MAPTKRTASPAPARAPVTRAKATAAKPLATALSQSRTSLKLLNWFDPTFLFLTSTFVSVLFIEADDSTKTLWVSAPTAAQALGHFFDPAVFIGVLEFMAFLYFARDARKTLTRAQSLAMHWHLWNGIIIYTMMDGLNGAFSEYGFLPLLHERGYRMVDRRYRRHIIGKPPDGPSEYEVILARTVNATEVIVYSWMSIMAAVGVATRARWHKTLEMIVLTMASYGTVVFVLPDMLDGCLNMQPMGVRECLPPLTPFYFFYVYFGVVINWIWFLVPLGMLAVNVKRDFDASRRSK